MAFTKEERKEIKLIALETINEVSERIRVEFEKRQRVAEEEAMKDPMHKVFKDLFGDIGVVRTSK